jgi:flagellar biosynthesis/type III secretory pathway chaperone
MFEDEDKSSNTYTEDYKKKISEEIKKLKPNDIKNTIIIEKKYTVWERLLRTLGMN